GGSSGDEPDAPPRLCHRGVVAGHRAPAAHRGALPPLPRPARPGRRARAGRRPAPRRGPDRIGHRRRRDARARRRQPMDGAVRLGAAGAPGGRSVGRLGARRRSRGGGSARRKGQEEPARRVIRLRHGNEDSEVGMNYEILDALSQITREKSVERQNLIETLEAGLISAGRKKFGPTANIQVVFDNTTGGISLFRVLDVVEMVEDPVAQISVSEARVIDPGLETGSSLRYPLSLEEFGRNAIQAAKQVFIQRVREAERERIYQEFADKVGTLVRGVVQQVDRGNVIVKLERCEGFLPARERIPRDHHRQNDYVRAIVLNVDKMARGPQVILSRTHPDFLRRLFEAEVPEIAERIVEIKAVAREAGGRSKISVYSHDPRVDAVG